MRKKSLCIMLCLAMMAFVGCSASNNKKTNENVNNPSQSEVVIVPETTEAVIVPETSKPEQTEVVENIVHLWSCETKVTETEGGTIEVLYHLKSNDGKTEFVFNEKPSFKKDWYEMFTGAGGQLYEIADFNFDGHLDFKTQEYGAMVNQYYNIRLWDPEINEFVLNQDFIDISNLMVNAEKKELFSVNYDRGLGNYKLYHVEDGQLQVVASIDTTFKEDGTFEVTETVGSETKVIRNLSEKNIIWDNYKTHIVVK